jgi:hypothetical protein
MLVLCALAKEVSCGEDNLDDACVLMEALNLHLHHHLFIKCIFMACSEK